ncbi:MAG: undecaprenyl-diphosphate phosphatase [Planctomycetota bacterium]|nr:undecaprenyl-diphosphate phosphatase [Planctomycetota bacterium]
MIKKPLSRKTIAVTITGALLALVTGLACWFQEPSLVSVPQAAALGLVEGLTEYLPVSSTGHLIVASHAMDLSEFGARSGRFGREVVKNPAVSAFEIVIQLGAILAVLGLYRGRVEQMALGIAGRDPQGLRLAKLLALAAAPAMIVGLALHRPIQEHLFGPLTVSLALIAGGLLMIAVETLWRGRTHIDGGDIEQMAYWQALAIGVAQIAALWPGTSRSMITIVAAMLVGMNRRPAAEFSFLLALPTLGAATVFEALQSYREFVNSVGIGSLLVGMVTSALVAAAAIKLLVKWLNHHGLAVFGAYRIAAGVALLWYFHEIVL